MELRFTSSARSTMLAEGVHRLEVEAVLVTPDSVDIGEVLVRYAGRIADRTIVVCVLRGSDPPLVVTVEVP